MWRAREKPANLTLVSKEKKIKPDFLTQYLITEKYPGTEIVLTSIP